MWETVIISALFGIFILISFITGLHYGSKIGRNEEIRMPNLNPVKKIKEDIKAYKQEKAEETDQLITDIMLQNIENYDGSGLGQIDIPRKE